MSETENALGYLDLGLGDDVEPWDGSTSFVKPGEYVVKVTKLEGGQSNAGNRKMVLTYEVIDAIGDRAEENQDQIGRTIVQSVSLASDKDGVARRLKSLFNALVGGTDKRGGVDSKDLLGAEMACEVVAETYTKTDPVTQEKIEKPTIKIIRERHLSQVDDVEGDEGDEPDDDAKDAKADAKPAPKRRATRGRRRNSQPEA